MPGSIEILGGAFGPCDAELTGEGISLPGGMIPFADMLELSVRGLDMEHSALGPAGAGLGLCGALFGLGYPVASNVWAGDLMLMTFELHLASGERILAKADSDTVAALREHFLA